MVSFAIRYIGEKEELMTDGNPHKGSFLDINSNLAFLFFFLIAPI